jgi:hypothetical protein
MVMAGPATYFPLSGVSKKQSCVSHSTPEAEIVAAAFGLRNEGLPCLQALDAVLGRKCQLKFFEDNTAMIRVCETGRNPTMRHLGRTHGVSVAWLHERFQSDGAHLQYVDTAQQAADIYTKMFNNPAK